MSNPESATSIAPSQRFKPIALESLTAEQRLLADAIRSGPRGAVKNSAAAKPGPLGGPFNVFLRSPEIGNIIQSLGAAIRFRSSLPPKLNELAIIVTAASGVRSIRALPRTSRRATRRFTAYRATETRPPLLRSA